MVLRGLSLTQQSRSNSSETRSSTLEQVASCKRERESQLGGRRALFVKVRNTRAQKVQQGQKNREDASRINYLQWQSSRPGWTLDTGEESVYSHAHVCSGIYIHHSISSWCLSRNHSQTTSILVEVMDSCAEQIADVLWASSTTYISTIPVPRIEWNSIGLI